MAAGPRDEGDAATVLFDRRLPIPPPVVARPPRDHGGRILLAAILAMAALFWMGQGLIAYGAALPASAVMIAASLAMVAIAAAAAAVAGTRLTGLGPAAIRWAVVGACSGLGAVAWCVLALGLAGRVSADASPGGTIALIGVVLTAGQAAGEEVLFRGWMQPAFARLIPAGGAALLTAALFAAMHLPGGWREPLSIVNILLAGWWMGLLALRSGGLAAPIAAHWGWNAGEMNLFGLYPNPGVGPWGALWGHDIHGPALWGGSPDGLNASVLMTLVTGAIVLLLVRPAKRA